MQNAQQALRGIHIFGGLSQPTVARLAEVARARAYQPGEMVILADDPVRAVYFIASGQVRVYRLSPSGRQQVLAQLGPGQAFNLVPAFHERGLNHATVEAVVPSILYAIATAELRRLAGECPDLALALLGDFAGKLDHLTNLVEDLSLRTVRVRLARFLLEQAGEGHEAHGWTQDEIAARLGTVRDMVGRTLRTFADVGLLRLDRQRIMVLDREGLKAEAEAG